MSRIGKFMGTESRLTGGIGKHLLMGMGFPRGGERGGDRNVLKLDSSDVCTSQ